MALNPTDEVYGVFINSNQSSILSTEKSNVSIPFQGNLADHDPTKQVQIALTSMLFTNTIYNITEENNQMNVLIYYAAGRGMAASSEEIAVEIPVGFYNITQLSNYLSEPGVLGREIVQQLFKYGVIDSYVNIFTGFGAIPQDPNDPIVTKAAPTNNSNTKIVLQSPDLGHMLQFGTDLISIPVNALDHSYIYAGIYVECDLTSTTFAPLLKMLGFFNIYTAPPPDIVLSAQLNQVPVKKGYGMSFEYQPLKDESITNAWDNTVIYTIKEINLLSGYTPAYEVPTAFNGIVYVNNSVVLTCAYELEPVSGTVIELNNGWFISGAGMSVPAPYIVGFQDWKGQLALTNGSSTFNIGATTSGNLSVGMSIGSQYNANTLLPVDPVLAGFCDYATGTIPGPGIENDHCYYITFLDPGGLTGTLNQVWGGTSLGYLFVLGTSYVVTTIQLSTPGGLVENMLQSPNSITGLTGILPPSNVTNLAGVDEIHVHCAQLRTNNLTATNFQPLAPADVIAVIPVEVEFGFKQNYQPPNVIQTFLSNTNIVNLEMQLTDAKGRNLDFHGVDWSITLLVTESDMEPPATLISQGSASTPFQDQLSTMEGTFQAETKRKRREIIFMDPNKPYGGRTSYSRYRR